MNKEEICPKRLYSKELICHSAVLNLKCPRPSI
jgi:hypothetical protein